MNFATLVRAARRRAGLTPRDLANAIGAAERAVWQVERGGGTLKTLLPILELLRIAITGLPPTANLGSRVRQARSKRG